MAESNNNFEYFPPASFFFGVSIAGFKEGYDAQFQEVSGLDVEVEIEEVKEGGNNDFLWRLPGRTKFNNLVMKRGLVVDSRSELLGWIRDFLVVSGGKLAEKVIYKDISVSLFDENGDSVMTWNFKKAYPVKWSSGNLNSTDNSVVIETIEFAHHGFTVEPQMPS